MNEPITEVRKVSMELDKLFLSTLNLSMEDIESMTLKDIDHLMNILNNHRRELEKDQIAQDQDDAAKNVGRCFIFNKSYIKVIDVPRINDTMTGISFNKYQYPAVWIDESQEDPIYHSTLFINGSSIGDIRNQAVEISSEEFAEKLKQVSESYIQKILEIKT